MQNTCLRTKVQTGGHVDKWMTLGVLQRAEYVQGLAEMITATMEDLSDQMNSMEDCLEILQEETEAVEERIEEMMDFIKDRINAEIPSEDSREDDLPF